MWTDRRSGTRRLGTLALACVALAGAGILGLASVDVARAQDESGGAFMGVVLQDLDQSLRDSYGYHGSGGVLVGQVESSSPADRAGLQRGDLIVRFGGRPAGSAGDLSRAVRDRKPGETVAVTVWRDGRERALRIVLGERPAEARAGRDEGEESGPDVESPEPESPDTDSPEVERPETPPAPPAPPTPGMTWRDDRSGREYRLPMGDDLEREVRIMTARPRLGVELQDLNPDLGAYFDRPNGEGVLVTRVLDDTPAQRAGLKAGDVILEIGGRSVGNAEGLRRELDRVDSGPVRVTLLRRGERQVLTTRLEKRGSGPLAGGAPRVFVRRLGPGAMAPDMAGNREEMRRQMDDLREQMDDLKEQMQSLKDQMKRGTK